MNDQAKPTSHGEILRSSSLIGGAAVVNIAAGLIKNKVVAILLGPAGVGLIVLLQNLLQTFGAVAGLSMASVGTRQIAEASGAADLDRIAVARRALFWAVAVLSIVGGAAFIGAVWWTGSTMTGGVVAGGSILWLALGVAVSVVGQGQSALLTGYRRIGDIAKLNILAVNIAAILGVLAILLWREGGILLFVLSPIVATTVIGTFYVRRLPRVPALSVPLRDLAAQWSTMARLGIALTVASAAVTAGQLAARILIQRDLGAEAVGHFQASWLVSVTYIGFVLQAMGTDFYPRVTAAIHDPVAANTLVNEQTEVALLLAAPVLLGVLGLAPWIVPLLYSHAFDPAIRVLQWQVLGDVLKVASWPLGFLLLASGASRPFMISEILAIVVLLAALAVGLPLVGLQAGGLAVVAMYLLYLPCVYFTARARTGFRWSRLNEVLLATLLGSALSILFLSRAFPLLGELLGVILAVGAGVLCLWRLRNAMPRPIAVVLARAGRMVRLG